ncbi:hypothetical protein BDK51DRAFT_37349, partial [Blyttiomyces helicus]
MAPPPLSPLPTPNLRQVWALLLAGIPPLFAVIYSAVRHRSIDVVGALVFFAFAVSGIVAAATDNARLLLFEKSLVTSILGVVFLISLAHGSVTWRGRRIAFVPLILIIVKEIMPIGDLVFYRQEGKMEEEVVVAKEAGEQDPACLKDEIETLKVVNSSEILESYPPFVEYPFSPTHAPHPHATDVELDVVPVLGDSAAGPGSPSPSTPSGASQLPQADTSTSSTASE